MLRNALISSAAALLWCLACTQGEADACGDDLVYSDGACRAEPVATAGTDNGSAGEPSAANGGSAEGGAAAGGADSGADGPNSDPNFGVVCAESSECVGGTDYCAMSPFGPAYCTASGCDSDESICPDGWTCFDVSQFAPGEPWICAQPM